MHTVYNNAKLHLKIRKENEVHCTAIEMKEKKKEEAQIAMCNAHKQEFQFFLLMQIKRNFTCTMKKMNFT